MRVRGYAGDGASDGSYEDPPAYDGGYTVPLVRPGHWEWVDEPPYGDPPPDAYRGKPGGRYRGAPRGTYPRRRHRLRRLRRLFMLLIGLLMLGVLAFGGLLLVTPSVSNAQSVARAFDRAHKVAYPGPPVPFRFAAALTATEDHRFYSEPGIDPVGVARVAVGALTGRPDPGGATLYQQLAKMLYASGGGVTAQAEEVALGVKLNMTYSHEQILRMYEDVAYFGHSYYGLQAASCGYFGVEPARLSWPQAAMLAGLVQAPSLYDPFVYYGAAKARQAHVLSRLVAVGTLTPAQARAYGAQSLNLVTGGGHC